MQRIILAIGFLLASCAHDPPRPWVRVDGRPVDDRQLEVDRTICRGETQKANLSSNIEGFARGAAIADVMNGCMARQGYVRGR